MKVLEQYILYERRLGRLDSGVDANLASYLLMSSSFLRAFLEDFLGKPMQPPWGKFAGQLARLDAQTFNSVREISHLHQANKRTRNSTAITQRFNSCSPSHWNKIQKSHGLDGRCHAPGDVVAQGRGLSSVPDQAAKSSSRRNKDGAARSRRGWLRQSGAFQG